MHTIYNVHNVFQIYSNDVLIRIICQEQGVPLPLFSNSNHLVLKFRRISQNNSIPQILHHSSYTLTYLANSINECGGELYSIGGTFTSPFYPANGPQFLDCRWDIYVPQSDIIWYSFKGK